MISTLASLVDRLDDEWITAADVIEWGAPVPSFGALEDTLVATLGLNPSNREFVDEYGNELEGEARRFHTLQSLGIERWADADSRHLRLVNESCVDYFRNNPYDRWFRRLDDVISVTGCSYYSEVRPACHLDLIPYATSKKWTDLNRDQRNMLLDAVGDTLALLLRDSDIETLVLNGKSVVDYFENNIGVSLEKSFVSEWDLPRVRSGAVRGIAYFGFVSELSGIDLGRAVRVLGYNHNIQSSYGVTKAVTESISRWVGRMHEAYVA